MTDGDPYVYPGTTILKNRLSLRNAAALERVERRLVTVRLEVGAPAGNFDLKHLCAIHHWLFQDIYAWAGETRTVDIAKGDSHFLTFSRIEIGMADVHRRLVGADFHRDLDAGAFAAAAACTIGDLNYVHPFREGNGRAQLEYLRQLGEQAGHALDLSRLRRAEWLQASKLAHVGDYQLMCAAISLTVER